MVLLCSANLGEVGSPPPLHLYMKKFRKQKVFQGTPKQLEEYLENGWYIESVITSFWDEEILEAIMVIHLSRPVYVVNKDQELKE